MSGSKLQKFFREKKLKADGAANIDWRKKKREWLKAVMQLYACVEGHLATPIKDGTVKISQRKKTITEDFIGSYDISEMVLQVGDETAVLSPKGALVVGATGRADLRGDMGEVTLILQPGNRWGVVESRTPMLKVVALEEESLLTALKRVMRP